MNESQVVTWHGVAWRGRPKFDDIGHSWQRWDSAVQKPKLSKACVRAAAAQAGLPSNHCLSPLSLVELAG